MGKSLAPGRATKGDVELNRIEEGENHPLNPYNL